MKHSKINLNIIDNDLNIPLYLVFIRTCLSNNKYSYSPLKIVLFNEKINNSKEIINLL